MPELCRFFGIVVTMNVNDHPPPHFHARYNEWKATIRIDDLEIHEGELPPRILGFVVEWAVQHRSELRECWRLARSRRPFPKIKPLE